MKNYRVKILFIGILMLVSSACIVSDLIQGFKPPNIQNLTPTPTGLEVGRVVITQVPHSVLDLKIINLRSENGFKANAIYSGK